MQMFGRRILTLGMVGLLAFGTLASVPAKAQVLPQSVVDALSAASNSTSTGDQLVTAGNALVTALNSNTVTPEQKAAILTQLTATGNANLISGVLSSDALNPTSKAALATSVVNSGNVSVIATIVVLTNQAGQADGTKAVADALAKSTNAAVVQNVIATIEKNNPGLATSFGNTVAATATANGNPVVAAAAKAGETGAPVVLVGAPTTQPPAVVLPSPSQTVTGSVN